MEIDSQVISDILSSLGVIDSSGKSIIKIISKAKEFFRILQMKLPLGSLKQAESCRNIITIELSCRILNIPIDKSRLVQLLTIHQKLYRKSFLTCKKVLNVTWVQKPAIEILSVKYGKEMKEETLSCLNKYRNLYWNNLPVYQKQLIDLNSSLYQTAAFAAVAKENKLKLDKDFLVDLAEVDDSHFDKIVDSIAQQDDSSRDNSHNKENYDIVNNKPFSNNIIGSVSQRSYFSSNNSNNKLLIGQPSKPLISNNNYNNIMLNNNLSKHNNNINKSGESINQKAPRSIINENSITRDNNNYNNNDNNNNSNNESNKNQADFRDTIRSYNNINSLNCTVVNSLDNSNNNNNNNENTASSVDKDKNKVVNENDKKSRQVYEMWKEQLLQRKKAKLIENEK